MASFESIDRLLRIAGQLLDHAAGEIRDAGLEPRKENIEHIGRALAEIFEIRQRIYAVRPDITPSYLTETNEYSEANRLLSEFMGRALTLEDAGNIQGAIEEFERYAKLELSDLHREIALGEIERLKDAARP